MAKFYVQSGTFRSIVQAESTQKAAVWAVHRTMQQVLPMEDDCESEASADETVLSRTIRVSEQGYDRDDAVTLPTLDVMSQWNEMVTTLDRLESMLYRAA